MYRVFCFGDSNTWGFNPSNGLRFPEDDRWTGVLRKTLGSGFEIIDDGQNGRQILDSVGHFNSQVKLNMPLDVVIIYLGINDIFFNPDLPVFKMLDGIREMFKAVKDNCSEYNEQLPEIILLGPLPVNSTQAVDGLYEIEAVKAADFNRKLQEFAVLEGLGYIDTGRIIRSCEADGVHIEATEHRKLGVSAADYVKKILKNANLKQS